MQPKFLSSGSTIGIAATARFILPEKLTSAICWLEGQGYKAKLASNMEETFNQLAGNDEDRASAFQELLDDDSVDAIWVARGGYGSIRLLPYLDWRKFLSHPKWIIGFSDITVFHMFLAKNGIQSIHAEMPINFERLLEFPAAPMSIKNALEGKLEDYVWNSSPKNISGCVKGMLMGGNLSVIYSMLSGMIPSHYEDIILFIEEIDEYIYHIDRMMQGLKLSPIYGKIKGIVVGSFTDIRDHEIPWGTTYKETIVDAFKEQHIPIAFDFPAGHTPNNHAFYLNREISLDISETASNLSWL